VDVGLFSIESYVEYEKRGQYGDAKTDRFHASLSPTENGGSQEMVDKIRALAPGQRVRLEWDHIYVRDQNGAHPERPIRVVEPQ